MTELHQADFDTCFSDAPVPADPRADLNRARQAHRTRTHRRIAAAALTLTAAAVLVAAPRWAEEPQLAEPAGPGGPAAQVQPSWPGCAAAGAFDQRAPTGPPPLSGAVPSDFTAVQVRRCTQDTRRADNGDQVQVNLEQEAPITPELLAYLAQPSEPQASPHSPGDPHYSICPAMLVTPPWLVLVDRSGRFVAPTFPTDKCHLPLNYLEDQGAAYRTLDYHDVSVTEVRVVESAAAQQAGCPMGHKNMLFFEPAGQSQKNVDPGLFGKAPIRRCDYIADPASPDSGTFTAGGPITTAALAALINDAAINTAPAAGQTSCATTAHFTVVTNANSRPTLYIETDGCRRILQQN